jgi:16S rRNA (cytidine1402-2'-O)-methyltransferase
MTKSNSEKTTGKLSIVATPIGNRGDFSPRAKETLEKADVIIAEDTRSLRSLFDTGTIHAKLIRGDAITETKIITQIIEALDDNLSIALITDAGTPAISDPGYKLVEAIRQKRPDTIIETIPGPSAITAALSISGLPATPFTFLGFPPVKKGRKTFFEMASHIEHTVVLYESPHRIIKTLIELGAATGIDRKLFIGRELTKMHEEGLSGSIAEIKEYFEMHPDKVRGEFVLVVAGA